jgi:hypothetical protein
MDESPGFWQAIVAALRNLGGQGDVSVRGEVAQQGAEQIAPVLPAAVMPMDALEKKRQERALIEAMFAGGR